LDHDQALAILDDDHADSKLRDIQGLILYF